MPSSQAKDAIESAMKYKNKYLRGIRKDVSVANLSLLNTAWYIKQLRDKEGIQFNMTETQIDDMYITQINKNLSIPGTEATGSFEVQLEQTPSWRSNEPFYRVSDQAVMQIIEDNFGHRPIYFAVTCESYIGFEKFTRNEGMVARVVSREAEDQADIERLITNIDEVYEYRSIDDDRVFKDGNMKRLVLNYGSGFVRAATHFAEIGDSERALSYIQRGRIFIEDEIKLTDFYTKMYTHNKDWDSLDSFVDNVIFRHAQGWRIYISFVLTHLIENDPANAARFIEKGLLSFPQEQTFAQVALYYAEQAGYTEKALEILRRAKSNLQYDVEPYIAELINIQGAI